MENQSKGRMRVVNAVIKELRIKSKIVPKNRRLVPSKNAPELDVVYTPRELAQNVVDHFNPKGTVLEPCRGSGHFYDAFPSDTVKHYCEIDEGLDFFDWHEPVNWIISNPPWSQFRAFNLHAMGLAKNVVWIIPLVHLSGKARIKDVREMGFGLREIVLLDTPKRLAKGRFPACCISFEARLSEFSGEFASWLKSNIGPKNFLSEAVEYGFGVHHGRIPRAIAAHMVRLFNQQKLPVLLCTSTLIEGVNTAAKTVMIYDKTINRDSYDFFTFSNIRGRAGRLGQHHVGQVMVFNDVPEQTELEVSPTMFADDDSYPDEYIIHMDKPDRSSRSDDRFRYYRDRLGLDGDDLKLASSIGLETSIQIKEAVRRSLERSDSLIWSNWPRWPEILEVCDVFCGPQKVGAFGAYNTRQLATLINKLRQSASFKQFLLTQDASYPGKPEERDNIFKFLRACEYGLPQNFALVELFVQKQAPHADYSLFLGGIASWFRPEILKELDEEGVPIQISERYYLDGDSKPKLRTRLWNETTAPTSQLTEFEKGWLKQAL